jgi:hypothetical protein
MKNPPTASTHNSIRDLLAGIFTALSVPAVRHAESTVVGRVELSIGAVPATRVSTSAAPSRRHHWTADRGMAG